jgi:hypothetical protein
VVTGHLTKSIAAYAIRSSQVRNDNNTKVVIPWPIHTYHDLGIQTMTTYIWCKACHKLIAKELLHEDCELNELTIAAMKEALDES